MVWDFLPPPLCDICRQWRDELYSEDEWVAHPDDFDSGEAKGFRVTGGGAPHGAYLKPTRTNDKTPRSANEKICADLGNDAGAPLPPALLHVREPPEGEESHVVLSLVLADRVWRYRDIKKLPDPPWDLVEPALRESSDAIAFDTWIGHQDRANEGNLVFFQRPKEEGYHAAYIDYSYTLNHGRKWHGPGVAKASLPGLLSRARDNADPERIYAGVERIEGMDDAAIRDVVSRIPDDFMSSEERDLIADALVERKGQIRSAIAAKYPEPAGADDV